MADEKDRLGSKLHDVEKAREDQWARQSDEKLLEQMRERCTSTRVRNASSSWWRRPKTEYTCTRARTGMARGWTHRR